MAEVPSYKIGRLPEKRSVNIVDLLSSARNFYNNRFDIIDSTVEKLQQQKRLGQVTDEQFLNSLVNLQQRQRAGSNVSAAQGVGDLELQQREAIAKQIYNDFIEGQKANIQKTLDTADVKFAQVQDDFEKGKINLDQYRLQRDAYFAIQKNKSQLESALPKYSYDQFNKENKLNTYASGRLRDVERERQIRQSFHDVFGQQSYIGVPQLLDTAGSYLDTEAIKKIFEQQKLAGIRPSQAGGVGDFSLGNAPKYTFPGTGGTPQAPNEVYSPRNIYK